MHVLIIGAGRVGQTLGRLLFERGYCIDAVLCRTLSRAKEARRFTKARRAIVRVDPPTLASADIILLTTPDRILHEMAGDLSRIDIDWKRKTVLHTSGAITSATLSPLRRRGARTGSLHPLQTFPSPPEAKKLVRDIYYTFEGMSEAFPLAQRLVRDLKGHLVRIQAAYKPLYHCAGSFACAGLLAPLSAAMSLYGRMGFSERVARRMLAPMVQATVQVALRKDPRKGLTGPLSRGDVATLKEHLRALSKYAPELLDLYQQLSWEVVGLASPHLSPEQARAVRRLLQKTTGSASRRKGAAHRRNPR